MKQCPKCFASMKEVGSACSSPQCHRAGIPVNVADAQRSNRGEPLCPACQSPMTVKVCRECGFELDVGERQADYLPFSLVGAQGSGKSNYLSVLLQQLDTEFCKVYDATLYPTGGDRTISHFERYYHRPLFRQGVCVPSTEEENVDPLTYTLVFPQGSDKGKTCNLAFYDACGKNFLSEADMSLHNRSICYSKGILFLIDPSQLSGLRRSGPGKKGLVVEEDAQALLLRTIHLLRAGLGLDSVTKKIPVPIAICLTKTDTLFSQLDPASFLKESSRNLRRPMVSAADLSSCSLEVQSMLDVWGGRELLGHVRSQFSEYAFFGFSALGSQPGEQNQISHIVPHRVLDPLLWLFWKNQIIRAG